MIFRLFVERRDEFAQEARAALHEIKAVHGVDALEGVRLFNRYDISGLDAALFEKCKATVFSEPRTDILYPALPETGDAVLAVEYLPGQYDQRADAAEQCIQLISQGERPKVRTARVYLLSGRLSGRDMDEIRRQLINPVECREASMALPETLTDSYDEPERVATVSGLCDMDDGALSALIARYGLAMDEHDLAFCRDYFRDEGRDPTMTELRVLDTYWSDHCRHTTFSTDIADISFEGGLEAAAYERYLALRAETGDTKPVTLMDMATLGAKVLRKRGLLTRLDDSPEINACTVKTDITVDGKKEEWLMLFKNETHNHPTEIEPFGGAATCLGGAIRDPLSGRAYVYEAMRVTGAADPRKGAAKHIPGKLSQRKIVTSAAAGYSSYGNQIGIPTGLVDELYHPGYAAKRMEIGAVIGAAPASAVRREEPIAGDAVILLGGRTGRDGCGGATGSSKAHTEDSLGECGAEVQKGNAPEERKLQRLFRNREAARLIKRCNDFGAGGVSVAIGELADGLAIDLDAVPKKYSGLDGTELAISESQERMAVVVAAGDAERFIALAHAENLEATEVARVTDEKRLVMDWRGQKVVDLKRSFIDTHGAPRSATVRVTAGGAEERVAPKSLSEGLCALAGDLNICSKRGLAERFDSTVGALSVLMPFGGRRQATPVQAMAAKFPVLSGDTNACSYMAYGFSPYRSEASPYRGAYLSVVESLAKLAAAGAPLEERYLSFQEYFPKPRREAERWGLPAAALLGALSAQIDLGVAAIGGKDSMSGTFEELDVPPTLVSFAAAVGDARDAISPEFKRAGSKVVLIAPEYDAHALPEPASQNAAFAAVRALITTRKAVSAFAVAEGGIAEGIFKMCLGNGLGFTFDAGVSLSDIFAPMSGALIVELAPDAAPCGSLTLGFTSEEGIISLGSERVSLDGIETIYDGVLEEVYPMKCGKPSPAPVFNYSAHRAPHAKTPASRPRALIPVFPGTNCEYESALAVEKAGGAAETFIINSLGAKEIRESAGAFAAKLASSNILFIPGGFSGGDEPDGSGRFITAFLRSPAIAEELSRLIEVRDGLVLGICNGFQALIKLGLVPFGRMTPPDEKAPTLTFNSIGRHQSKIVRTRVASNKSPWLAGVKTGEIYSVPVSHGEGRFVCDAALLERLTANGQIATQYVDLSGEPTMDVFFNPNASFAAVEGITSPDGRVLGKMGHSERIGKNLYKNVLGEYDMHIFDSAVRYFE